MVPVCAVRECMHVRVFRIERGRSRRVRGNVCLYDIALCLRVCASVYVCKSSLRKDVYVLIVYPVVPAPPEPDSRGGDTCSRSQGWGHPHYDFWAISGDWQ